MPALSRPIRPFRQCGVRNREGRGLFVYYSRLLHLVLQHKIPHVSDMKASHTPSFKHGFPQSKITFNLY